MSAGSQSRGSANGGGFGKRGNVRLSPAPQGKAPPPASEPPGGFGGAFSSIPNPVKWAGGGLAVMALAMMLSAGAGLGGGGFLGGLLGGMLANRFMHSKVPASAPQAAAPTAAAAHSGGGAAATTSQTVSRGGFGATAGAHGGSFGG